MFSDHNRMKSEIQKFGKYKYVEINTFLNNQWVKTEIKGKLKAF